MLRKYVLHDLGDVGSLRGTIYIYVYIYIYIYIRDYTTLHG